MLLRELESKSSFFIFIADVRVRQQYYTQWIPIQVSARNTQEAKQIILAQYGRDATVSGLRRAK